MAGPWQRLLAGARRLLLPAPPPHLRSPSLSSRARPAWPKSSQEALALLRDAFYDLNRLVRLHPPNRTFPGTKAFWAGVSPAQAVKRALPYASNCSNGKRDCCGQYQSWVYPAPVQDMAEAVAGSYWDRSDPSLFRRKLWRGKPDPDALETLAAGCEPTQPACYAFNNRHCRVVGLDLSDAALGHEAYLKQKHGLNNLDLFR